MTTATIVVSIVSAVISAVSSLTAAGAQYTAAEEEKKIGGEEAKSAERQAQLAREANEIKQKQHREMMRRVLSKQRAEVGASGLMGIGSPLAAYQYTKQQGEEDLNLIKKQGELEIETLTSQARILRRRAATAYKYGMLGAALTALGGAGQAVGQLGGRGGSFYSTPKATTSNTTLLQTNYWSGGEGRP